MSIWLIARAFYETAKISVPTLVDEMRGKLDTKVADGRVVSWSRRLFAQADLKMTVRGREHLETDETFIVMSNHQSLYDTPAMFLAFEGRTIRMITKKELFRVPI